MGDNTIVRTIDRDDNNVRETFVTVPLAHGASIKDCVAKAQDAGHTGTILRQHIFYPAGAHQEALETAEQTDAPTIWTESDCHNAATGGVFLHALEGPEMKPITNPLTGQVAGYHFSDSHAHYCFLSGLHSPTGTNAQQTEKLLATADDMLAEADMNFQNVLRTWFYNDDILGWYDEFNAVRTKFFQDHEILENLVPASTGIGAANPFGAALTASLFAMKSHDAETTAHSVASPLQGSAQSYGSSFSRAVLYNSPDHRRLTVSGTASIDMEGKTIYTDDVQAQIEQTFKIVQALLESQQFGWEDTVRGIGYVRNEEDLMQLKEFMASGGAPEFPLLQTINVVCRQDLLFELEVNAVQT